MQPAGMLNLYYGNNLISHLYVYCIVLYMYIVLYMHSYVYVCHNYVLNYFFLSFSIYPGFRNRRVQFRIMSQP